MRSGSRKNRPSRAFTLLLLLGAVAFAAGCSTAQSPGGSGANTNHILPSGSSVAGWLAVPSGGSHASTATLDYIAGGGSSGCMECHGSDLSGGISGVSCFDNPAGCHHDPIANWTAPAVHGATAKLAPGSSGFASCQICHARDFSGGGAGIACADCHGPAHPLSWRVANGSAFDHNTTDTANAPVCFGCHADSPAGNPNNPHRPPTPAAAGTPPGCFNGTMCHNQPEVHPAGWVATSPAAQPHGDTAKKDGTVAGQGFPSCQACHGNNFAGATVAPTCLNNATCHGAVASPHARKPWRASAGSTYTHTDTVEAGNAAVCAICHFPGSPNNPADHPATPAPDNTAPGCFNSTLCHGESTVPHSVGSTWVTTAPAAQPHGNSAKATPGSTAGFDYCKVCHGTGNTFTGGTAISCYPCHGNVGTPHPSQWRTGDTYVHTSTAGGNAPVCAFCHTTGANSPIAPPPAPAPGAQPDCFNNTLCHGEGGAPHPVGATWVTTAPAAQPHGNSAKATPGSTTGFAYCQVCHGTGTTPPANFGGGSAQSCYTCHLVSAPHAPAPWRTSAGSIYTHASTNTANAPVCQECHFPGSLNNPPNHPPSPAPAGTPADCFNGTLCHAFPGS